MSGLNRRTLIKAAALTPFAGALGTASASPSGSALVYISPIKSNGNLSKCQAEVWFVSDGQDYFVVCQASAWRARAVRAGLDAQLWLGDVGVWTRSGGRYKELPSVVASTNFVEDKATQDRMLQIFGRKYADEWGSWGPRFRNGLADGSRVMIEYSPQELPKL